ncbi:MAG: family 10 glycosylhydrolase [Rhodocyclaceae bacterium]|nr:family 10 glycosylhydrolase [Rhodocyclaceae bacterium]
MRSAPSSKLAPNLQKPGEDMIRVFGDSVPAMSRRDFLKLSAGLALLASAPRGFAAGRGKAPFRALYSNDTTNLLACTSPYHQAKQPFTPQMLEASVDEVAGKGVDVHLLQPGLGWIPWWKSKVYPAAEHYRWYEQRTGKKTDSFGAYLLGGGDMVKVFVDRCRQRGQRPFISLRLNDAHHLEDADSDAVSRFYVEHPDYRIGTDSRKWDQRGLNWAIPEVRALKLAFVRELAEGYDIDGIELDFMRYYSFFQLDNTTTSQRADIMTEFVRNVRQAIGPNRWLCARVPCELSMFDPLGIDLPAMVRAGLDMVNASANYFTVQQSDIAAIRQQVPEAAVYEEMCHTTWLGKSSAKGYDDFNFRRTTREQYYTAAHLAYARGLDGVSLFNFVYYRDHGSPVGAPFSEPPFDVLERLHDKDWLARQPQHWILAQGWGNTFGKAQLPRNIKPGGTMKFAFDMAPPAGGWKRGGRLRVQCQSSFEDARFEARLNGTLLAPTDDVSEPYSNPYPAMLGQPDELRAWQLAPRVLIDGSNKLEITMLKGGNPRLMFIDMAVS